MVKLGCLFVSERTQIVVSVDTRQSVDHLKRLIKSSLNDVDGKTLVPCAPSQLKLFLANTNNAWLIPHTPIVNKLIYGQVDEAIQELMREEKQLQGCAGINDIYYGTWIDRPNITSTY